MTNLKPIRLGFQILVLGIFVFQMQQSVQKYIEKPITLVKATISRKEITAQPRIYVCQLDQFDYSKGRELVYERMTNLMSGNSKKSGLVTWKGKSGNLSYQLLTETLYRHNYTNLMTSMHTQQIFSINHGFCQELSGNQSEATGNITSTNRIRFIMVDPFTANHIRIEETPRSTVEVGPTNDNEEPRFEWADLTVDYTITDSRIRDGSSCKDYGKMNSSYDDCLKTALQVAT